MTADDRLAVDGVIRDLVRALRALDTVRAHYPSAPEDVLTGTYLGLIELRGWLVLRIEDEDNS